MRRLLFASLSISLLACTNGGGGTSDFITEFPPDSLDGLDITPDPACTGTWVVGGRGKIVDQRGNPISGARPQMCLRNPADSLLCLMPPESAATGFWHQAVEGDARCVSEIAMRALLPASRFGTTYCHVPLTMNEGVVEMREPIILYDVAAATGLPPVGDPATAREVTFADGLVLEVTPSVFFGDDYEQLAATRVSLADPPCFAEGLPLDGLYVLGPETSVLNDGRGFPIRLPADGLAEGTRVELHLLGGLESILADGSQIEEADFPVYGTATVVDGMIVSDPGSELPYLSWLGYRAL